VSADVGASRVRLALGNIYTYIILAPGLGRSAARPLEMPSPRTANAQGPARRAPMPNFRTKKSLGLSVCCGAGRAHGQLGGEPCSFQSAAARHCARSGASRLLQPAHLLGLWQPQHDVDAWRSACALGPASLRAGRPRAGRVPPAGLLVPGAAHRAGHPGHAALDAAGKLSHVLLLPPVPPGPMRRASTSNPNP
jgi:hypothetical protein